MRISATFSPQGYQYVYNEVIKILSACIRVDQEQKPQVRLTGRNNQKNAEQQDTKNRTLFGTTNIPTGTERCVLADG